MEEDNNLQSMNIDHVDNNNLSIIDEAPELMTLIEETDTESIEENIFTKKIRLKLSKGYTIHTVIKSISYSINETSFIIPFCLRKLGIISFLISLIILSLSSVYIFHLLIDEIVKFNLYENYHNIIQKKTNKFFNSIYFLSNIIYHFLIIIFEIYFYLFLFNKILFFYDITFNETFYEKFIILLISLIVIEYPFSFVKRFEYPDLIYIIIAILTLIINIICFIFVITGNKIQLIKINIFKGFSKDYSICFSIIMNVVGWQNQISKLLNDYKIKSIKRFYKVVYLSFFIECFLIVFISFVVAALIDDNNDIIIFLLDYNNLKPIPLFITRVMAFIFCLFVHIIIAHHMHLIQENIILFLKLISNKKECAFYDKNHFSIISKFFILVSSNAVCLFIDDISLIIMLYGGIFTIIINYICPTALYSYMVSKNSIIVWIAWIICFIVISIGIIFFILNVFL